MWFETVGLHSIHNIALYPMQSKQTSKKSDWPPSPWQESNFMQSCLILSPYFSVYKSPDQLYIYWVEMGSVERCNDKYHRHNESQFELKCSVCPPVYWWSLWVQHLRTLQTSWVCIFSLDQGGLYLEGGCIPGPVDPFNLCKSQTTHNTCSHIYYAVVCMLHCLSVRVVLCWIFPNKVWELGVISEWNDPGKVRERRLHPAELNWSGGIMLGSPP